MTALLQQLDEHAQALVSMLDTEPGSDARFWLDALLAQCDELCTEASRIRA